MKWEYLFGKIELGNDNIADFVRGNERLSFDTLGQDGWEIVNIATWEPLVTTDQAPPVPGQLYSYPMIRHIGVAARIILKRAI